MKIIVDIAVQEFLRVHIHKKLGPGWQLIVITVHVPQARHHPLQPVSETVNSDEVVWEGLLWGSGQKR